MSYSCLAEIRNFRVSDFHKIHRKISIGKYLIYRFDQEIIHLRLRYTYVERSKFAFRLPNREPRRTRAVSDELASSFIDITYEIGRKRTPCRKGALFLVRRQLLPANWADIKAKRRNCSRGSTNRPLARTQRNDPSHTQSTAFSLFRPAVRPSFFIFRSFWSLLDVSLVVFFLVTRNALFPAFREVNCFCCLLLLFPFLLLFLVTETERLQGSSVYDRLRAIKWPRKQYYLTRRMLQFDGTTFNDGKSIVSPILLLLFFRFVFFCIRERTCTRDRDG